MASIWTQEKLPQFPSLQGDLHTDVLIIGGGIAGLLCAHHLHKAGVDYLLAEADTICSGVTQNTTAKLTAQHGLIYHKIMKKYGREQARLYYDANADALAQFGELCQSMDRDYCIQDNYVYSSDAAALEKELSALSDLKIPAEFVQELPLPLSAAGAVRFSDQARFHPLKFLSAIAKELNIREHTPIRELAENTARTGLGMIRAEKIIIATHFPILNKHGSYFLKLYQHRSYCLALEGAQRVDGMYVDDNKRGLSFREQNGLLILGGGGHRTGKKGGGWDELKAFARAHYPEAKIKYRWAAQDCITLDGIPYIGQYSTRTPNLYVATGFNKWGMTSAMVAAKLLTDQILGKENPCSALYSPSRSILHPQLACNALEATVNLLSPSAKRCPHLGCALKWNPHEHSWDCPCHGSRFAPDGKLLDGPSTGNLKK